MRVLLLGEFSALHKNLKEGLVALGHDVTIASAGDGWKRIEGDIDLGSSKKKLIRKIEKLYKLIKAIPKFKNYDVVQFVAPVLFPRFLGLNSFIVNYIFEHNKKIFLVGAGCNDSATSDFLEANFKYPQLYEEIKKSNPSMWSQTPEGRKYNDWFLSKCNGFIPIMYEYAQGYRDIGYSKLCPTIPIPINIDKIQYEDNIFGEKLVVFHGLNREGVKGTPIIREAMEKLQRDYPNEVECVIDGKMPLDVYLNFLGRVNVIIDQAYSVSIGVNGVYNLAMGKVVVGGGEQEFLDEFKLQSSPLIPIEPAVEDIYNQLEIIIKKKDKIRNMGRVSRNFAEQVHDYRKVAQQYVDAWNSKG
jgi:glycosyltransferase involved in cell wall biosynthesis